MSKKDNSKAGSIESMTNDIIKRDIDIVKLEDKTARAVKSDLKKLETEIIKETAASYPSSPNPKLRRQKAAILNKTVKTKIGSTYKSIQNKATDELGQLALLEAEFNRGIVNNFAGANIATSVVAKVTAKDIVNKLAIQGSPSKSWWARQSMSLQNKYTDVITKAIQNNWTIDDTIDAIRGTSSIRGIMRVSELQAEALARTGVQSVANAARLATVSANSDVIQSIQWLATLDSQTSSICKGLHGKQWEAGTYKPINHGTPFPGPTAHWRCRSTQIPITKAFKDLPKTKQALIPNNVQAFMGDSLKEASTLTRYLKTLPDKELLILLKDKSNVSKFKRGKLTEAELLRLASSSDIDLNILEKNLKQFGITSLDEADTSVFKGKSLADAEKLIVNSPNEIALIYKRNKLDKIVTGDTSSVEFDWFTKKDLYDSVVTHNHGAASSFSTADIELFFKYKPKQFRIVMPVNPIQAGFLGATADAKYATMVLEKIGDGPDIPTKSLMNRIREEREAYFKAILDTGDDIVINETQARFATYMALRKVSDDVPGFQVKTLFNNGIIGKPESIDNLIEKLNKDRKVSIVEPESELINKAKALGFDVSTEELAENKMRGVLKEIYPERDSYSFNLNNKKVIDSISKFIKKNPEAIELPLSPFEYSTTFNKLRASYAPDIRESGGLSNNVWLEEATRELFRKAKVDFTDPNRVLSLKERKAIFDIISANDIKDAFNLAKIDELARTAAEQAKARNKLSVEKATNRIKMRQANSLQERIQAYRLEAYNEAKALRTAKERLARAKANKDVTKILEAEADINEIESLNAIIGGTTTKPKLKTNYKAVPRFANEKHVLASELPDLDQAIRAATGKSKPVREAALEAKDKLAAKYDKAYQDFIHMDTTEFEELLDKSIRGALLSEHDSLVVTRGLAAASSKYTMLPDKFKPTSFEDLFTDKYKRRMLTNYQAFVNIDTRLKRLRNSKIFQKSTVDPITGEPVLSIAEKNLIKRSQDNLIKYPVKDKKYGDGYKVGDMFIPKNRMETLLDLFEEGKYIAGVNRMEPFVQSMLRFADVNYDWDKVRNFKALLNGTKAVPGLFNNKVLQYTEKLRKEWDASKNVSIASVQALARKSEAGVNVVSKDLLVKGKEAIESTKISKRFKLLIRYANLTDEERLIHELVNEQRLPVSGLKAWSARLRKPQQAELIKKSADGDIVVLEPMDLRKKSFRDLNTSLQDQRSEVKIAEVNRRIGEVVLDARIYKNLKTNLAGKLDLTKYNDEWEALRERGKVDLSLYEYSLRKRLAEVLRLSEKDLNKIYATTNTKINEAYKVSIKAPKRALSLNAIDDQKAVALATSANDEAIAGRVSLLTRGKRAAKELATAVAKEKVQASSYGKALAKSLIEDSYKLGASYDPTTVRLNSWIKGSKYPIEELSDKILASILDGELSQGAMGPMAFQIGSMVAKSAGVSGASPEIYMQVGAKIIQQAEKNKFVERYKAPLLNKEREPIRDANGNFKQAWHVRLSDKKLQAAALSEPSLRRFSKLPQNTPPKFDLEKPWEYEDGTNISKVFDKEVLERVYGSKDSIYRKAIEAKNNTAFVVDKNVIDFYDRLRASGLKNADGEAVIPSWDLSIEPKSAKGLALKSKTAQWNSIHSAAKAISGEEQLFFKYTSDFRGRSYASGVVTPQGPPQAKAYFRFKKVAPITNKENAKHFWIEMSARTGQDKLPKTKNDYEDWALVRDKFGKEAADRRFTVQDYGFEVATPEMAKIWDDVQSGRFWKNKKAQEWLTEYEEEWPEVFAAAGEINKLRKHIEQKTGKKLFKINKDGNYSMALDRDTVEKAMLDYKPTLIPHIDGTTNAYQQMGMITRDEDLGLIANLKRKRKLYDAYYYTGLTIKRSDDAVIAAVIKRDNPSLFYKTYDKIKNSLANSDADGLDEVGAYLKQHDLRTFNRAKQLAKPALEIKKKAVEAMPEVFGKDATVSVTDLRSMFKKPVMLQPYGASITTILNAIKKEGWKIAKKDPEKFKFLSEGDNAKLIGQAVVEMNPIFYPKAKEYQTFLRELVKRYNAGVYNPITKKYTTDETGRPIPIPIRHKLPNGVELNLNYKESIDVPVEVAIGNDVGWLTTKVHTDKIKATKQMSAVSANMTHAHDAAWDQMWTDILKNKGVNNFVGIHDAAGTDFGNMDKLHDAWRQAGVNLYQNYNLFEELLKQAAERGVNIKGLKPPKLGNLDVKELLDSEYAIH